MNEMEGALDSDVVHPNIAFIGKIVVCPKKRSGLLIVLPIRMSQDANRFVYGNESGGVVVKNLGISIKGQIL